LLDDLADAFHAGLPEGALILAPALREMLGDHLAGLRKTVAAGVSLGIPMPALSASLAWYDTIRTARGSANLIQAQRDFFGAHGFERGDIAGAHHGTWNAIFRD
jgi:6-phosphogluconate dehydrogenase